jgi:TonB family protein
MVSYDGAFGDRPEAAGEFLWLPTGDLTIRVPLVAGRSEIDAVTRDVNALRVDAALRYPFLRRIPVAFARGGAAPTGDVILSWSVGRDAWIRDVSVESSSTGNQELDLALVHAISAWNLVGRAFSAPYQIRMHLRFDAQNLDDGGTRLSTRFGLGPLPAFGMGMFANLEGLRDSAGEVLHDSDILAAYKAAFYPEGTVLISLTLAPEGRVTEAQVLDSDVTGSGFTESLLAAAAKLRFAPPYDGKPAPLVLACTLVARELRSDGQTSDLGIVLFAEGDRGLGMLISARAPLVWGVAAWTGEQPSRDMWKTVVRQVGSASIITHRER